jgi:orotate phosphoribosyltransferase
MRNEVLELLSGRQGHFLLESGHHGDLWLDLERLCLQPQRAQALAARLIAPLSGLQLDAVCGPLVEGAFIAILVALQLETHFIYSSDLFAPPQAASFPRVIGFQPPSGRVFEGSV